jgi:Protein of unknown function (DUF4230)
MAGPRSRSRIAVFLSIALLVGAFLLIGTAIRRFAPRARALLPGGETTVSQSVIVEQTRAVAKLVSSESSLRDVVVYQNRHLGSTKRSLVVVTGKVLAGIDLDQGTQIDVDNAARQVHITLPRAKVLGVEVTQLRTYDERSGLWNPFRPADRDTIYQLARDQLIVSAGELGLASHAEESARKMLTSLIHPDGYTVDVTFNLASPGAAGKAQD